MIKIKPRERSHSRRRGSLSPFHQSYTWSTELIISWRKRCSTRLMLRIEVSTLGSCRHQLPLESFLSKQKRSRRNSSWDSRLTGLNRSSNREVRLSLWNSISLTRDPDLRIRLTLARAQLLLRPKLGLDLGLTWANQSKEVGLRKGAPKIHMIVA
jgi:hypothetical protein